MNGSTPHVASDARPRPPATGAPAALATVSRGLLAAERAAGGQTGSFILRTPVDSVHGSRAVATLLFEGDRLCWASCEGYAGRLTDRLAAVIGTSPESLEPIFQRCRSARVPFGEFLMREGLLGPEQLRETLLRQVALSSVGAARWVTDKGARWEPFYPAPAGTYDASFTFTTVEVVQEIRAADEHDATGVAELVAAGLERGLMLALWVDPDSSLPWVPAFARDARRLTLTQLDELVRRLDPARRLIGAGDSYPTRLLLRSGARDWLVESRHRFFQCFRWRRGTAGRPQSSEARIGAPAPVGVSRRSSRREAPGGVSRRSGRREAPGGVSRRSGRREAPGGVSRRSGRREAPGGVSRHPTAAGTPPDLLGDP